MSALFKFIKLLPVLLSFVLSSCIILPGHRVIIDDSDFYLHIEAPSKERKKSIRFNSEKTDIVYIPKRVFIKLRVTDIKGKHKLKINRAGNSTIYDYKLNGDKVDFGIEERKWFATQVPRIISKTGLNNL